MHRKSIIAAAVIFVLIIAGMFTFAYLKKSEISTVDETPTKEEPTTSPYDYIERVDAKHFYVDGEHTLAGEIMMPTPCDLLTWETSIAESFPEQVTVLFDVINTAEVCSAVMTPQRFKVTFTASENASIRATFRGRDIKLNLIPAGEDETQEDFELYIKG